MKATFNDFYGQHIAINNETASGNVRMEVRTLADLNKVQMTKPENCDLVTDISLNQRQLKYLIETLSMMLRDDVE